MCSPTGTGGLNIDACRNPVDGAKLGVDLPASRNVVHAEAKGRWPANVVHDGSDEVLEVFARFSNLRNRSGKEGNADADAEGRDTGSPARFFYSAKATKHDRAGSSHPTVKPVALLEWLCRLITPRGGTVLARAVHPRNTVHTVGATCLCQLVPDARR